ncbi:hypothetical protein Btru_035738 [Bulinus truncatus]|nr:hypothetical protein Btru_035738 [Bulinus truncatus]
MSPNKMFTVSMASMDDFILLLHASDAVQWAQFISTRLAGEQYNITSISKDVMTLQSQAFPSSSALADAPSAATDAAQSSTDQGTTNKDAGTFRDSGRCSRNAVTEISSIPDCISSCKACVVFISPDFLDLESPFSTDVTDLSPKNTVYLMLGVDIEETRSYFAEKSGHVFNSYMSVIDGTEKSICDAMYAIIQAFENMGTTEELIYEIPPSPVQRNQIVKVFPKQLTEKEDVYVLLERPAEDDVIAVLDVDMTQEVPLTCEYGRLYKFTLPDELHGEISFKIECQSHCLGSSSVKAYDRVEQLNSILKDLVDPLTIVTSALGLKKNDLDGLDTLLTFRLQELPSSLTFKTMFPCEDVLNSSVSEEPSKLKYPTLLHFAADLNLRMFCTQLLQYPGMLGAACTENIDGEFPCQIAARKGFMQLEKSLMNFVEEIKGVCDDPLPSPTSLPTSPTPAPRPTPPPHQSQSGKWPGYVNERVCTWKTADYVDMAGVSLTRKNFLDQQAAKSDSDLGSPVSDCSDDRVFAESPRSPNDADKMANQGYCSNALADESFDSSSSLSTPGKAWKILGVEPIDICQSTGSTSDHNKKYSASARSYDPSIDSPRRLSVSSNCEDATSYLNVTGGDQKHRTTKIKSFLNKIRGLKKSTSENDGTKHGLSKSYSNRSNKSSKSFTSDGSTKKKKVVPEECQERDSGSFSDEEKSSPQMSKKSSKQKTFKEREKPMMRTLSKRAQSALNEKVENAPTLPKTDGKSVRKSTFKSFIQDEQTERF